MRCGHGAVRVKFELGSSFAFSSRDTRRVRHVKFSRSRVFLNKKSTVRLVWSSSSPSSSSQTHVARACRKVFPHFLDSANISERGSEVPRERNETCVIARRLPTCIRLRPPELMLDALNAWGMWSISRTSLYGVVSHPECETILAAPRVLVITQVRCFPSPCAHLLTALAQLSFSNIKARLPSHPVLPSAAFDASSLQEHRRLVIRISVPPPPVLLAQQRHPGRRIPSYAYP